MSAEPFECWVRDYDDGRGPLLFSGKPDTFQPTDNWKRLKWDAPSLGWYGELHGKTYSVPREAMESPGKATFWAAEGSDYADRFIVGNVSEPEAHGVTLEDLFAEDA